MGFPMRDRAASPRPKARGARSPDAAQRAGPDAPSSTGKPRAPLGRAAPARGDGARHRARARASFLFDEPLSNLDASLRVEMRLEIARLRQTPGHATTDLRHPRPGRGDDPGRQDRCPERWRDRTGGQPDRPVRTALQPVRRGLHRIAPHERAARPCGGRRRAGPAGGGRGRGVRISGDRSRRRETRRSGQRRTASDRIRHRGQRHTVRRDGQRGRTPGHGNQRAVPDGVGPGPDGDPRRAVRRERWATGWRVAAPALRAHLFDADGRAIESPNRTHGATS